MNSFLKKTSILLCSILIFGCQNAEVKTIDKLQLNFLSEFILPENILVDSTVVGGLSGIDFYNDLYYLVCDDASNPRYYEATIEIKNTEIFSIDIKKVIRINDTSKYLDLESIRYNAKTKQLFLTSEGHIYKGKPPLLISVDSVGNIENNIEIPKAFLPNSQQKPRHNATLEGLSNSYNDNGYWIAMELPLEVDGPEPQLTKTKSPVRITFIDTKTNKAENQFVYLLDAIAKQPKGNFSVNGLTDILEYDKNKFFVIERSYSSGLGNQSNTIKIFSADASQATNTLQMDSLSNKDYIPATKKLLLNFERLRDNLTNNSIDNIEGICFGPILSNGNKTLLLVSDNNFNRFEKQLNQFILLEIATQKSK